MNKKLLARQEGFTIVELMIVVSILAILVAIVVLSYRVSLAKANEVVCRYNLRITRQAVALYQNQSGSDKLDSLPNLVPKYMKPGFEFQCPLTKQEYSANTDSTFNLYSWKAGVERFKR